jgi:hypothetical protein
MIIINYLQEHRDPYLEMDLAHKKINYKHQWFLNACQTTVRTSPETFVPRRTEGAQRLELESGKVP